MQWKHNLLQFIMIAKCLLCWSYIIAVNVGCMNCFLFQIEELSKMDQLTTPREKLHCLKSVIVSCSMLLLHLLKMMFA